MCLHPEPIGAVSEETARVARAAFPRGNLVMRIRDELSGLYREADFADLFPARGQPAACPWRLAVVTVLQFLEGLTDRQAADAVRSRLDWKYTLGLELTDPGFHFFSVLTGFRTRLLAERAEPRLLTRLLDRLRAAGLVIARGRQRTDSTHVLAAVRTLNRLELVGETVRFAVNRLAAVAPEWLRARVTPAWLERYQVRVEHYRLPKADTEREALAATIGADGVALLRAALDPRAPAAPGEGGRRGVASRRRALPNRGFAPGRPLDLRRGASVSMRIRFTKGKRADKPDVLTCVRDDGTTTWMHERPGFVDHDLAHYAAETAFGYRYGFFGLVRSGWALSSSDFGRDPVTKAPLPWPDPAGAPLEPVEFVVSLLQREGRGHSIAPEDVPEAMRLYVGDDRPPLPEERLAAARRTLRALRARWREVPPGESLELAFAL